MPRGTSIKSPELVTVARWMRREGRTINEIAETIGVSYKTVWDWLDDSDGHKARKRKERYDRVCSICGGRASGSTPSRAKEVPVCKDCAVDHYATWTDERILQAIRQWVADHNEVPSASDFQKAKAIGPASVPSAVQAQNRFGTWNNAVKAAGFTPLDCFVGRNKTNRYTEAEHDEMARRYAAGEASTSIAADFGCVPATVVKHARGRGIPIRKPFHLNR